VPHGHDCLADRDPLECLSIELGAVWCRRRKKQVMPCLIANDSVNVQARESEGEDRGAPAGTRSRASMRNRSPERLLETDSGEPGPEAYFKKS
jgi:hypothetical protein